MLLPAGHTYSSYMGAFLEEYLVLFQSQIQFELVENLNSTLVMNRGISTKSMMNIWTDK